MESQDNFRYFRQHYPLSCTLLQSLKDTHILMSRLNPAEVHFKITVFHLLKYNRQIHMFQSRYLTIIAQCDLKSILWKTLPKVSWCLKCQSELFYPEVSVAARVTWHCTSDWLEMKLDHLKYLGHQVCTFQQDHLVTCSFSHHRGWLSRLFRTGGCMFLLDLIWSQDLYKTKRSTRS